MQVKRWVGAGVLGLVLLGAVGARAAETVPVYKTSDECWEQHQVSCFWTGDGWSPGEEEDISNTPGEKVIYDEENLRRQGLAMQTNVSGTLDQPVVAVDMTQVIFPDVQPYLDREVGRVRVPIRFVSEQMGAAVEWNSENQSVTITRDNLRIWLQVDNNNVVVNGKLVEIDAPPRLLPPGRVMVPLRFISEAFGAKVDWVGEEPPHPRDQGWGKYQVWIWMEWGYWGKYDLHDRLFVESAWFYRGPLGGNGDEQKAD